MMVVEIEVAFPPAVGLRVLNDLLKVLLILAYRIRALLLLGVHADQWAVPKQPVGAEARAVIAAVAEGAVVEVPLVLAVTGRVVRMLVQSLVFVKETVRVLLLLVIIVTVRIHRQLFCVTARSERCML